MIHNGCANEHKLHILVALQSKTEKGKGIRQYTLVVTEQSIGNIANNIVITMNGAMWVHETFGETAQ